MTTENSDPVAEARSALTSGLVERVQGVATRLRFLLALPAAAVLFLFTDRGPMWPGVAVALAGESLQLWAAAHLRKNIQVVKSGPYAWLRNPMYMGRFFVGLGLTLLTWRWFIVLPYIVLFWLYAQARVLGEERHLVALFGEEYKGYCAQVRRWLPLPPRQRLSDERWSWSALGRNHEVRVAAGVVVVMALLKLRLEALGKLWGDS
jgi:protein-S-isoprenylcysteine O-methyltransferase Ste14